MQPLIRWPGGQSRTVRKTKRYFPKHRFYVEPFGGGGSYLFGKDPSELDVLGDTSPWLIPFYDDVRRGKLRGCRYGFKVSRRAFNKAASGTSACDRLALSALAFGGGHFQNRKPSLRGDVAEGTTLYKQKLSKLPQYERRLRRTYLTRRSFESVMKKFDSPETWHLLDPPWPDDIDGNSGRSKAYYGVDDKQVTPEHVAEVCSRMKGKVWVLYNIHPRVRRAFALAGFHHYRVRMDGFHPTKGAQLIEKLLITNYDLRGRRERRRPQQARRSSRRS